MSEIEYGQWIGNVLDDKGIEVRMMLNIEKRVPGLGQALSHVPRFREIRTCATFVIPPFQDEVVVERGDVRFFDSHTGNLVPVDDFFKTNGINQPLAKRTHFKFQKKGRILAGTLQTDTGTRAEFELTNTTQDPAPQADHILDWKRIQELRRQKLHQK